MDSFQDILEEFNIDKSEDHKANMLTLYFVNLMSHE
jgi:hypothetical protein